MLPFDMPKPRRRPAAEKRRSTTRSRQGKNTGTRRQQGKDKSRPESPRIPGPREIPTVVADAALAAKILSLVHRQRQSPPSMQEIASRLRLAPGEGAANFAKTLHDLELSGGIVRVRQDQFAIPSDVDLVVGTIQTHRDGSAHLLRDKPGEQEFYLTPENTATALPGDRVVVRHLRDQPPHRGYQPCGRVIRILKRGTTTAVGTLEKSARFWHVVPDDKHFVHNIYVPQPAAPLRPNQGDKVVVKLGEWKSRHTNPEGEIVEVL